MVEETGRETRRYPVPDTTCQVRLALLGVGLGIAGGHWLTRALSNQLYGISAIDPETYFFVVVLLLLSVLLASYVPARRATAIDPTVALRYE